MNIIQTCGSYSWGGLEIIALQTAFKLSKLGHSITFLCPQRSKLEFEAKKLKINVIPILNGGIKSLKAILILKNLLSRSQYDVLHTHLSHDLWTLVSSLELSSMKQKPKLFLTKHIASGIKKGDFLHKYLYKRVNRVFAVSSFVKESVINTCPINQDKVSILHSGISLNDFNPVLYDKNKIRDDLGLSDKKIVIGMLGRITPGKGHEEFLYASKLIKNKYKKLFHSLIIGSPSYGEEEYAKKIKNLISILELEDTVTLLGYRSDIPKILSALNLFIFPSHEESLGLALLEAMALELPVVASNNAGILDIVIDGKTGVLIPPKNYTALANAIILLIENPELCVKLGKEGRRRVRKYFNIDETIKTLENIYKSDHS